MLSAERPPSTQPSTELIAAVSAATTAIKPETDEKVCDTVAELLKHLDESGLGLLERVGALITALGVMVEEDEAQNPASDLRHRVSHATEGVLARTLV